MRARAIAVAVLAAVAVLPGSALASHKPQPNPYTCNPSTTGCPDFNVGMYVRVGATTVKTQSSFQLEYSQTDRSMPVMKADYYLPKGWRFGGINDLDPAMQADGVTPATSCDQIHNADGTLRNAEALSSDTGMVMMTGQFRNDPDEIEELPLIGGADPGTRVEYGIRNISSSDKRNPSVSFLRPLSPTSWQLCYYHRNNASSTPASARVFQQTAILERISGNPTSDWKLSIDLSSVYKNADLKASIASIIKHDLGLGPITSGTWNRVAGTNTPVPFSRTPDTPGIYTFKGEFYTCANGLSTTTSTGCVGDVYTSPEVREMQFQITDTPGGITHFAAKLTGPITSGLCTGSGACRVALLRNTTSLTPTWTAPATGPNVEVKGYVLALAVPGNEHSLYFRRIITNPAYNLDPDYDPAACTGVNCTTTINFPVTSADGSTVLGGNSNYNAVLTTIYTEGDERTDGRCDDGTGPGAPCAGGPHLSVAEPRTSTFHFMVLSKEWPNVFVLDDFDTNPSVHDPIAAELVLADFSLKEGMYLKWFTNDVADQRFAKSTLIVGENDFGGTLIFGSGATAGATKNWRIDGVVDPIFGLTGLFTEYDLKNPGIAPPALSGWPEADPVFLIGVSWL